MSIIVLLSPNHFSIFFLFSIIICKSKATIFSLQREIIITSLCRKLTKVSTNNFNIDIKGISDPLEMCKNIVYKNPYLSTTLEILSHVHRKCITQVLP